MIKEYRERKKNKISKECDEFIELFGTHEKRLFETIKYLQQKIDNINKLLIEERDYYIEGSLEYKLIDEIMVKVNNLVGGKDESQTNNN